MAIGLEDLGLWLLVRLVNGGWICVGLGAVIIIISQ